MLLKKLRIFFWTSSCLAYASCSLACSSLSLALASLSSLISLSNRWIYSTEEVDEAVVTRKEESLMPSPFTIPDFFLKTKFEISCVRGIALGSWQWSSYTLRIVSYHLKEKKTSNHNINNKYVIALQTWYGWNDRDGMIHIHMLLHPHGVSIYLYLDWNEHLCRFLPIQELDHHYYFSN